MLRAPDERLLTEWFQELDAAARGFIPGHPKCRFFNRRRRST
jgi:hypothetical protein